MSGIDEYIRIGGGFSADFPIVRGKANKREFWIYEYDGEFVFSVEVPGKEYHDHWHPQSVEDAVNDVVSLYER